ncbi:MAG: hypothetical protein FD177_879 [Desulfovibrionaceae bacterium]|nr:MAG: hypothetical protein FD177_879 [Desulfovibrionaceae bacterium]
MNEHRMLAALAVFRELYNSKNNPYDVLREFIIYIIVSQHLRSFSEGTATAKIEEFFGLRVPVAVVKYALNALAKNVQWCVKKSREYIVDNVPEGLTSDIEQKYKNRQTVNVDIFKRFVEYLTLRLNKTLNEHEEKNALNSFCAFLLNEKNGESYSEYISKFVLHNKDDVQFQSDLNEIREGMILYSGITYDKPTEVGFWNDELTLFLDQEILFNCYGLNGDLFKSYFEDFYRLVNEINVSKNKKIIQLRYFPETKDEIESFFSYAERIVRNESTFEPGNPAMDTIVNGCENASDVREKRTLFFHYLETIGIRLDDSFVFDESKYPRNILSSGVYEILLKDVWGISPGNNESRNDRQEQKATRALNILNKIHCLRESSTRGNFYAAKYHFLTGTGKTRDAAWHESIKGSETVPLTTTLDWMTNKFWSKLNKGFQGDKFPSSSQVLAKARVVLSTMMNRSISEKYDELVAQHRKGNLPKELVQAKIVDLIKCTVRPEEIDEQSIDSNSDILKLNSLEHFKAEQEADKLRQKQEHEEIERLRRELAQKEHENSKLKDDAQRQANKSKLEDIKIEIVKLELNKTKADKTYKLLRILFYVILSLIITIVFFSMLSNYISLEWKHLEPTLSAIRLISWYVAPFIMIIFGIRISPERARTRIEDFIKLRINSFCGVQEDQLAKLKEQAERLKESLR